MLTQEQIQAYAKKYGVEVQSQEQKFKTPLAQKLASAFSAPQQEEQSTFGKVVNTAADFTGGKYLAQGIGKALAKPMVENRAVQETLTAKDKMNAMVNELDSAFKQGRTEDVKRLQEAIRAEIDSSYLGSKGSKTLTDFQSTVPTNKEIIGSTVRLAGTLAAPSLAKEVSALTGANKAVGLASGAGRGALSGLIGGSVEGAVQGAGYGLEQNKDAIGVIKSSLSGGAIGGVTGGVLGGLTGAVTGKLNANKLAKQNFAKDLVSPKETTAVREQAIQEGRTTKAGLLKKSEIIPSKKTISLADAVEGVVSDKKSVVENVAAINQKIKDTNEGVKSYIASNKRPFNTNQLNARLQAAKDESKLVFASDTTAEKTYDAVIDEFKKYVSKKDTLGLFEARQTFDKVPAIKKLLESAGLGENVKKSIVLDVRRAANEYVADLLPVGNKYRVSLLAESRMIEALGNIAEKEAKNIGLNTLQKITRDYPVLKWIAGGLVGGASVGVGGAIIGSTD